MRNRLSFGWIRYAGAVALTLATCAIVAGQDNPADRLTVSLSDPARPAKLSAKLINGGITVTGYDGAEIVVEARARGGGPARKSDQKAEGMKRITMRSTGLEVEEENNVVRVGASSLGRTVDLTIQVPVKTSLKLNCVNGGNIGVTGVSGEVEVENVNGSITVTDISGVVVANTVNGEVKAEFKDVTPDQPMSFSSLNGDVDVTFPAGVRANVAMETENGSIYTDFDVEMQASSQKPIVEDSHKDGGQHRIRIEKAVHGTINGGGAEIRFKTFNGSIYIRSR